MVRDLTQPLSFVRSPLTQQIQSLYASEQPLVARQSLIDMAWGKCIGPHSGRYVLTIWQEWYAILHNLPLSFAHLSRNRYSLCMRRSNARRTTKFNRHGLGKEFQVRFNVLDLTADDMC